VFIESAQGGQVEAIHVEDGDAVEAGQLLLELSNTALQLDLISREAEITEQLNNLRSLELAHQQNQVAERREGIEIEYELTRLRRVLDQERDLASAGALARSQLEDSQE